MGCEGETCFQSGMFDEKMDLMAMDYAALWSLPPFRLFLCCCDIINANRTPLCRNAITVPSPFSLYQCNKGCIKAYLHMGKAYLALKKYSEVSIITCHYSELHLIHILLLRQIAVLGSVI